MFRDADLRRAMLEAEQAARHTAGALRDGDPQAAAQAILRIRERVEALDREIEVRNRLADAASELRAGRLRMAKADPAGAREALAAAMSALDGALEALRAGSGSGRSGSPQASQAPQASQGKEAPQAQGEKPRPPVVDLDSRRAAHSSIEAVRRELVAGAAESLARGDVQGAIKKLKEADARLRALGGGSRAPEPVQAAVRQAQSRAAQAADAVQRGQVSAARRLLSTAADGLRLAVEAALMGLPAARQFERRKQDAASLSR